MPSPRRRFRWPIIAGLIAGTLVAAGLAPVAAADETTTTTRTTAAGSITWTTCADEALRDAGAECGTLAVPLDYANPDGAKVQLALSRVRHTVPDAQAQGIMLVNAGGPGVPGVGLSPLGQAVPNGGGGYYDWIGFDPRGVGASQPSLSCDPDYFGSPGRPTCRFPGASATSGSRAPRGTPTPAARTGRSCPTSRPSTAPATWTASGWRWAPTS